MFLVCTIPTINKVLLTYLLLTTWGIDTLFPAQKEAPMNYMKQLLKEDSSSSAPGQNGRHFADDIFRCFSVNEHFIF